MTPDLLLLFADRIGVFVFAISGGIVAVRDGAVGDEVGVAEVQPAVSAVR